jgi:hypothetical protein
MQLSNAGETFVKDLSGGERARLKGRQWSVLRNARSPPNDFALQPPRWSSDSCEAWSVCKRVLCATVLWSSIFLISKQSLFEASENQRYTDPTERVNHNSKHRKQARGTEKPNR